MRVDGITGFSPYTRIPMTLNQEVGPLTLCQHSLKLFEADLGLWGGVFGNLNLYRVLGTLQSLSAAISSWVLS